MKKKVDDPKVQGRYFDNAIPKDLVDYGMIPEFVGRFPVIVSTKGLDIEDLVDILTVPKNSIMKQYRRLFAMDDVNFHVTEDGLQEIAKTAFTRGTGARGLRSITDNVLMKLNLLFHPCRMFIRSTLMLRPYEVKGTLSCSSMLT